MWFFSNNHNIVFASFGIHLHQLLNEGNPHHTQAYHHKLLAL